MLSLLLDIHISPRVALQVRRHRPDCPVETLRDWKNGAYRSAEDDVVLSAAAVDGLTLVMYDINTIAPLVKEWNEAGRLHAGILYVAARAIPQNDVGGLVRALVRIWDEFGDEDWTRRIACLQAAR